MNTIKNAIVWTAALALFVAVVGCGDDAAQLSGKNVVKIGYLPITHALPALEAKEELEAEDDEMQIELVRFGAWPDLLDALNTNQIDGASVLVQLAMLSKEKGVDLKAVALGHKDGNVVATSDAIRTPDDMKGKTFAIPHRQSSHNILMREALAKGGLTVDDVEIVEMAPPEMPAALAGKQIDGFCVAEPYGAKAVALNVGKAFMTSEELWQDSLCCAFVLNGKFLETRPDAAAKLVKRYKYAGKQLTKERALEVARKYLNQSDDVLDVSLQWISYDDLEIARETYDGLRERVVEHGLSANPPTYEEFVKNDF